MNHKQFIENFKKKLAKRLKDNDYFFYKIPDFPGGPLRPFDSILVCEGKFFAIEFKVGKDRLKKHQEYYLEKVEESGSMSLVIYDDKESIEESLTAIELTIKS